MTSDELVFIDLRNTLRRYNNPIIIAEDTIDKNSKANWSMIDQIYTKKWMTVQSADSIAVMEHEGYCDLVYYEVGFEI